MRRIHGWYLLLGLPLVFGMNVGCVGRAIGEGVGVVTGASGKVVHIERPQQLAAYKGLKVESVTVTPGLKAPDGISSLIRSNFQKVAAKKKLTSGGTPCLLVSGEVTNYESADAVDTAIGPLEECIVRAKLTDADGKTLAVANLVARAKSTTAGGEENLAEGLGKALGKWLKAGGIKTAEEEKEDQKE